MNKKASVDKKESPIMPAIGDYHSRAEWEDACWRKISASKDLLELLATSNERHNLVMRAAAIDALALGKSYRQIGKELWLSLQTISGIKKALIEKSYRSYLERSKKERKKKVYSRDGGHKKFKEGSTRRRTKYGIVRIP